MGNQGQEPPLLGLVTAPARRGYPRYVTDAARCYSGLVTMAASEEAFARASGLCRRRPR